MNCALNLRIYITILYIHKLIKICFTNHLSYCKLNSILSKENQLDYRSLPYVQCSQQILRQIDKQYLSFYKVLKSPKMKGKKIRLPKYKDKESRTDKRGLFSHYHMFRLFK